MKLAIKVVNKNIIGLMKDFWEWKLEVMGGLTMVRIVTLGACGMGFGRKETNDMMYVESNWNSDRNTKLGL